MNYSDILKQYFGYDSFRGIQQDIVESIGSGHDTLGLMPTGGGKSIAFQVPALAMSGVCIVITPLIALMKDQVEHLRAKGILAAYINSSISKQKIMQIFDNAILGGLKFLYISPERISTQLFRLKIRQMKVCYIAVDEAHCISQWGYDFRPSYLQIARIRELVPDVPVVALTATATEEVMEDIQRQLQFKDQRVFRMSFRRDNLVYVTRKVESKYREALHILRSVKGSAIIYLRDRIGTREIAGKLEADGISATYYHAGLDFAVKDQRQAEWQAGSVRVMVATNAFGMGIDKPDVRLVIHMDCPDSIEAYFQEAGRGGRDGRRSYAVMLYDKGETSCLMRHAREAFPPKEYIRKVYDHLAYYFQLAVDSGEGAAYNFDMERFCYTFKHHPAHLTSALSILQRAGYIEYDADPDNHPRVQILLTREQLYHLRAVSCEEDELITSMMRCYGSLFSDLTYIEEAYIAMQSGFSEERVHVILKDLSRRHIIKYVPRHDMPRITYLMQRIDSERLHFGREIYEDLQERLMRRVEAVINYIENASDCRQQQLLAYFGEKTAPCGKCDACLASKRAQGEGVRDAESAIRQLVTGSEDGVSPHEIYNLCIPRKELEAAVALLREQGKLLFDNFRVKWKE